MIYRDNAYPYHYRGPRGTWAIPFGEMQERSNRVEEQLQAHGLHPGPEYWPDDSQRLESGHKIGFHLDPESNRWRMLALHPGDSTGGAVWSDLGSHDHSVAANALRELHHPHVVKAMGEQWQRAAEAGDPQGTAGTPKRWVQDNPYDSHFSHYE